MNKENAFVGGAVFTAIASSLCCVLPLVALVFGLGAFGMGAIFESVRPYLLVLAFAALAFSFYRVYFRREACSDEQVCATKPFSRTNHFLLWTGLIVIVAFALAPYYTGYLMVAASSSANEPASVTSAVTEAPNETVVINVDGMTCAGCEPHINETLSRLNGVAASEANYQNKNVKVVYNSKQISLGQIKAAINEIGYQAK